MSDDHKSPKKPPPYSPRTPLREGRDYYINSAGLLVFTEDFHRQRGYCCESGCLHCPYGFKDRAKGKLPPEPNEEG